MLMNQGVALRKRISRLSLTWPVALLMMVLAFAAVLLINPSSSYLPDLRQVIYRTAEQVRAGHGLTFNANERLLLVPAPAYILLMVVLALFSSLNMVVIGQILFAVAVTIGAISLYRILCRLDVNTTPSIIAAAVYCLGWPLWAGVGTALPFASALCLLALELGLAGRWRWAGIIMALAVLSAPEAIIFAVALALLAANRSATILFCRALVVLVVVTVFALWLYYRSTALPHTASTGSLWSGLLILKDNAASTRLLDGWAWIIALPMIGLAAWGWNRQRHNANYRELIGLLALFAAGYTVIMGLLLRVEASWRYAPLWGPLVILAVIGIRSVAGLRSERNQLVALGGLVLLSLMSLIFVVTIPLVRPMPNPMLAQAKTIGISNTTDALRSIYFSTQSVIAFDGQLQPELKAMLERQDKHSMLIRFAPDVVFADPYSRIKPDDLTDGSIKLFGYRAAQAEVMQGDSAAGTMFLREAKLGEFAPTVMISEPLSIYGPDIRLTGYSLDQTRIAPNQAMRIRLDWLMNRSASKPITVDIWLRSGDYILAHARDTFDQAVFRAGPYSTYHVLAPIQDAWAGPVSVDVAVIVSDGAIARHSIAQVEIIK
jgi:hypothetical protein